MDLTHSININGIHSTKPKNTLYDALDKPKTIPITNAIGEYRTEIIIKRKKEIRGFDIIPASPGFQSISTFSAKFSPRSMDKSLISLKNDYDYILIDTPPNWNFF
jgi:cellulose biosynthesis protein BcsQ